MNYFNEKNFLVTGIVEWPVTERDTGRYGIITLYDGIGPGSKRKIISNRVTGYGTLSALVIETRDIVHKGDPRLKILPKRPEINDKFILGKGIISYPDFRSIKLDPLIEIPNKPNMDIESLYNIVNQTVNIYLTKE